MYILQERHTCLLTLVICYFSLTSGFKNHGGILPLIIKMFIHVDTVYYPVKADKDKQ